MSHALSHWLRTEIITPGQGGAHGNERSIRELASFMRMDVEAGWGAITVAETLIAEAQRDDDYFLDLVDGALQIHGHEYKGKRLIQLLDTAGSVWTVAEDYKSLSRVVSDEAQATFDLATAVADEAATELREAWANAFGRNGNPSDAWDHAIKAMEALFIPLVIPKKDKANLGGVIGELRNQGHVWKIVLPGKDDDNDVGPLVGMLDGIWPNIDRHQGNTKNRPPTEPEARAVVTLAATIIQWHREGWVVQKR